MVSPRQLSLLFGGTQRGVGHTVGVPKCWLAGQLAGQEGEAVAYTQCSLDTCLRSLGWWLKLRGHDPGQLPCQQLSCR